MARRHLIRQNEYPYHITSRTNHKSWFQIPLQEVWTLCKESLCYANKNVSVEINCFTLMGNHYHLLVTTPDSNIDRFMMFFNKRLSMEINKQSGVINHKFSNRYKWTIVDNKNYLYNVYRYIYQNPVRAQISKSCYNYPYSSIHFTNKETTFFNYKPHIYYKEHPAWFEKYFGSELDHLISKSLKKEKFKVAGSTSKYMSDILNCRNHEKGPRT